MENHLAFKTIRLRKVLPDMEGWKRGQGQPDHLGLPGGPQQLDVRPLLMSFQSGIYHMFLSVITNQEKRRIYTLALC